MYFVTTTSIKTYLLHLCFHINHMSWHTWTVPVYNWQREIQNTSTESLCQILQWMTLKVDSHIACRAHDVPLPCRAAKGLECVFPIWFTQCGRVWFTLAMHCTCRAHAMLGPCRSSQGHGTARPSRDGLWATCPRSTSSGYHAEFHGDCYQKHTNSHEREESVDKQHN